MLLLNPFRFFTSTNDPYWANVISLLHFNGANGSTTITDEKGLTWACQASASLSTTVSKFGGSSLKTNTETGDAAIHTITDPETTPWRLGSSYTIEAFIYVTSFSDAVVFDLSEVTQGNFAQVIIAISAAGALRGYIRPTTGAAVTLIESSNGLIPQNTQIHVALSVDSGFARLFANGVLVGSNNAWPTFTEPNIYRVGIGGYTNGTSPAYSLTGYIDEFRATNNVARYTTNFTPPSTEFPDQGSLISAKYWRIYITANNGDASYTSFNEWELRETSGGTDLTNLSSPSYGQSSAFVAVSTHTAAFLTNNDAHTDPNDAWVTVSGQATPSWAYAGLKDAGGSLTAYTVREITIWPQAGGYESRAPKDFIIQASDDATNWTNVKSFTNVTGWVSGTSKVFTIQ